MSEHILIHKTEPFPVLNDRQKKVLKEVCDSFISTGIPVGSRTISRFSSLSCSPATIRNEMADLESMGYLYSPHTSAGRIPTEMGYRFYVQFLLEYARLSQMEEDLLGTLAQKYDQEQEHDKFLRTVTRLTSDFTRLAGVALPPQKSVNLLQSVQLIRLLPDRALFVLVDECGRVSNQTLVIPRETSDDDLLRLSNFINAELCRLPLADMESQVIKKSQEILHRYNNLLTTLTGRIREAIQNPHAEEVFMEGFINFFEQSEFKDPEKMRSMIKLLDQKERLLGILAESLENGDEVVVKVGSDSGLAVNDLAVVTARYRGPNRSYGRIGVIGPMRMDYARVVTTLVNISQSLSGLFMGKGDLRDGDESK